MHCQLEVPFCALPTGGHILLCIANWWSHSSVHCQLEVPFRVLPVGGSILCIASWRENLYGAEGVSQSDQKKETAECGLGEELT